VPPIPLDLATRLANIVAAGWTARPDRVIAVTLLREELVPNDFGWRRVLLQGVQGRRCRAIATIACRPSSSIGTCALTPPARPSS